MKFINFMVLIFTSVVCSVSCAHSMDSSPKMTEGWSGTQSKYLQLDDGTQIRYLKLGNGKPLVMLHSLRTQLDLFYKLAPLLKDEFTLYLIDLPGHGYSSIDKSASYDASYFILKVTEVLKKLNLGETQILGESIGASIALSIANDSKISISKVFAVNPYDYGEKYGGGIRRSENGFWISTTKLLYVNFRWVLGDVLRGGVHDKKSIESEFLDEMYKVGFKEDYGLMFDSLLSDWESWIKNRSNYISVKDNHQEVFLIYGEEDWSNENERQRNKASISPTEFYQVKQAGHFISQDKPEELKKIILENQ